MQKGDLVTHVYNDPDTIADAEKKGFRMVDAKATAMKPADGTEPATDTTETEASADGTFAGMETEAPEKEPLADTDADATADTEPTGSRNRRRPTG